MGQPAGAPQAAPFQTATLDHAMLDAATLRALADLSGPERAFLTIYLDARDEPSVLDPRFQRIRALLADQPAELEHFEESLSMARELVESHESTPDGALAVYTSWAADLRRAYALPEPVGTKVWMGDAPYLRPAAELLDEHETYAAVVVDNKTARIYLVSADEVDEEGRVRGDVKNRVKKGGWSQKRYARRRDKQIEGYATEVAAGLATLADERPFARLVLIGSDEPVQAVRDALRTDLRELLVGSASVDGNATDADALEAAAEIAEAGEREAEQELWHAIREQGVGPGLAAFGATSVLKALTEARADAVLVDREAEIAGTKCRACEHVAHGTPTTCGACGSSDVFRVDLVESFTEQAARTGADVDFADPFDALAEVGGVAALLRYSLAEDDAEREERERRARAERAAPVQRDRLGAEADTREDAGGSEPVPVAEPEPATEPTPVVEPEPVEASAAETVPEPVLTPVETPTQAVDLGAEAGTSETRPAAEPRPVATREPASGRRPSSPRVVPETTGVGRGASRKGTTWGLLVLVLLAIAAAVLFVL